jgi:hypothetical protein
MRPLSQSMAGDSGVYLSFQLLQEAQIGGPRSRLALGNKQDFISKITNAKTAAE